PSFKLLDEDSDEGDPLVEINNDHCKIFTERTVFDHIREKAKSLPSLAPKSTTEYLESDETLILIINETLSLIRKRTRERQLALNDNTESLNLTDDSNPCEESIEPDGTTSSIILNGDTIFEHIRKKAKSFPRVDEIKSLSTKSHNISFDFDLFADAKSNIVQKENALIIDSEPVKPLLKAATREKQHKSPSFASRQCCSLESEVADPFRGFKSVFSFL
nr:DExH-box ATP-dependent RNA helicase DExH17 isoform X1 [Tanacetum cinerariifolium]